MSRREQDPGERKMPFGFDQGVKLRDIRTRALQRTRDWCAARDDEAGTSRFKGLIDDIDEVLGDREGLSLGLDETGRKRSTPPRQGQ